MFSSVLNVLFFTFFQLLNLLCGEGGPVPLQLPLEPQPELGVLVRRGVVVGVAVRGGLVQAAAPTDAVAKVHES